ncbi:coenzyme f390 synthetase II [Denitrovibrio acetiphilus DSM 12809]|uniref:Coenzyme f390 synthetase II n=1 Tax=Denitrovibrio acetiphilus (strain DSM 12809 / NBRC 114555 / N2460) TaxID=522772 RepID=D4H740_DENA2|nr:phenylacetate--CoA ligase family protein [Denitrovibrio acetiphilus]ADD69744.1 coenzyme f390 synthetase II [Denitrovibrio acetiphilus DSM 12809]
MLKLTDIQILKLGKILHHIRNNNLFYSRILPDERITSYEALSSLPFMTNELLAQGYPFAYSCADTKGLITGRIQQINKEPVMNFFTDNDITHIAEMTARTLSIAEVTDEDTLLLISGHDEYPSFADACEKLRHFLIHAGKLSHRKLYQLINDADANCLMGTTKDITAFIEYCRENSLELTETSLKSGIFCGKPLSNGTRKHLEKESGMDIYMTAGFGIFLHGMASDCKEHDGMHLWDDHYIVEIIDDEGKILPDGEEGELVITTLTLEALPLIRFRTGRKSAIVSREKCTCGLHTVKIDYPS